MNNASMIRRGLAAFVAFGLLGTGPVWAEEQQSSFGQATDAAAQGRVAPKVDLRLAARAFVADETGLMLPLPGESGFVDQATGANSAPAAASGAATGKRTADWSTVPPNAPRTTHAHKIAAYTALAVLTVVSVVLVVRETRKEDPVLAPGTPVRIP
jgi:hypothetical protein